MPCERALARTTMSAAFQRMIESIRSSISSSPGYAGSCSTGIVFT